MRSAATTSLAGIVVSLAAALVSFVLLYRLAEERLGADGARRAVLYLAVFPMSLFLQAVYSESLFLALALGAFLLAERRRWLGAGAVTGLAVLTRISGVALLPALAVLAWRRPPAAKRALASLCLAPLVFAAYPLYLGLARGDAFAFAALAGLLEPPPLARRARSAGSGTACAPAGPASGSSSPARTPITTGAGPGRRPDARRRGQPGVLRASSSCFVVLTVIAWRRFGAPYGLFCAVSLAIPLSVPSERWPLLSLPRFGLVLFPCFLALAALGGRPRVHTAILVVSSIMLGVAVTQWALWQWVA